MKATAYLESRQESIIALAFAIVSAQQGSPSLLCECDEPNAIRDIRGWAFFEIDARFQLGVWNPLPDRNATERFYFTRTIQLGSFLRTLIDPAASIKHLPDSMEKSKQYDFTPSFSLRLSDHALLDLFNLEPSRRTLQELCARATAMEFSLALVLPYSERKTDYAYREIGARLESAGTTIFLSAVQYTTRQTLEMSVMESVSSNIDRSPKDGDRPEIPLVINLGNVRITLEQFLSLHEGSVLEARCNTVLPVQLCLGKLAWAEATLTFAEEGLSLQIDQIVSNAPRNVSVERQLPSLTLDTRDVG